MPSTAARKPLEAVMDQNEGANRDNHKAVSTWEKTEFLRDYASYHGLTGHVATETTGSDSAHGTVVMGGFVLNV